MKNIYIYIYIYIYLKYDTNILFKKNSLHLFYDTNIIYKEKYILYIFKNKNYIITKTINNNYF